MNILITGGGGFIGSHLSDVLSDEHEVWAFDNWLTGKRENGLCTTLDILDRGPLYALANKIKPDVVIHCAASYSDPDKWHRDADTNISGCINAAAVAKYHDAHLIYFQTILPPVSSYAISKLAGEQYLHLSDATLTVFRLANVYGPRNLSGPVPTFYKRLTEDLPITVVQTTRDMLYIDDLVRGVESIIGKRTEGIFDMCSGVQRSILEIYNHVAGELEIDRTVTLAEPLSDDVQGEISYGNRLPGWEAVVPLGEGIQETIDSYRKAGVEETHTHLRIGAADAS